MAEHPSYHVLRPLQNTVYKSSDTIMMLNNLKKGCVYTMLRGFKQNAVLIVESTVSVTSQILASTGCHKVLSELHNWPQMAPTIH